MRQEVLVEDCIPAALAVDVLLERLVSLLTYWHSSFPMKRNKRTDEAESQHV